MRLCGIVRTAEGLLSARATVAALHGSLQPPRRSVDEMELFNLLTIASLMIAAAATRTESRGVHLRADFSERDDVEWKRHVTLRYDPETDETVVKVLSRGGEA
jgi:L-aspartate oxidase